jgi:hypothetical protein
MIIILPLCCFVLCCAGFYCLFAVAVCGVVHRTSVSGRDMSFTIVLNCCVRFAVCGGSVPYVVSMGGSLL